MVAGLRLLVNYDVLRASELRSGYKEEDAWNIAYSGCQWYCSIGKEYCDQDTNSLVPLQPMFRTIEYVKDDDSFTWEDFMTCFRRELDKTIDGLD